MGLGHSSAVEHLGVSEKEEEERGWEGGRKQGELNNKSFMNTGNIKGNRKTTKTINKIGKLMKSINTN